MLTRILAASLTILLTGSTLFGAVYNEDFEDGTHDWSRGTVQTEGSGNQYLELPSNGSWSYLGGSRSTFGGGWYSCVDVYLDPAVTSGAWGFEVTQALNNSAGNHVQDALFHVGVYQTGSGASMLGVTAPKGTHSTSSEGNDPAFYVQKAYDDGLGLYNVTSSGWYRFGWQFSLPTTAGDPVVVDWMLLDDTGVMQYGYSEDAAVTAAQAGGNRYMWFIGRGTDYDSLMIDNAVFDYGELPVTQTQVIPEPLTMLGVGSALIGLGSYLRRRRKA